MVISDLGVRQPPITDHHSLLIPHSSLPTIYTHFLSKGNI